MVLEGTYKVKSVLRKTTAKMFSNVVEGDNIKFQVELKHVGGYGKTYATYIRCQNLRNMEVVSKSFNKLANILHCFEFEE